MDDQQGNHLSTHPESLGNVDIHSLPVREIVITRNNVLKDMVKEFLADDIIGYKVEILFKDEHGNIEKGRGSGLLREALSIFWREFAVSLSVGAEEKVPCIRHDYQSGRVFLFGEESVSQQLLTESFYKYMSKDECGTL